MSLRNGQRITKRANLSPHRSEPRFEFSCYSQKLQESTRSRVNTPNEQEENREYKQHRLTTKQWCKPEWNRRKYVHNGKATPAFRSQLNPLA